METSTQEKNDGPISCTDADTSQVTAKATYISHETQIGKPLNEGIQDVTQSYGTQETMHAVRQMRTKEQARFHSREIHMSYDIWYFVYESLGMRQSSGICRRVRWQTQKALTFAT